MHTEAASRWHDRSYRVASCWLALAVALGAYDVCLPACSHIQSGSRRCSQLSSAVKLQPASAMLLTLEALKLHPCALQRMLVHPGWHAVVPCQSSVAMVYLALETGSLDLGVDVEPAGQKVSTVRELLQVPTADMQQVMLSSIQTCANAKAFKRADMDECHLSMMKHAGKRPEVARR